MHTLESDAVFPNISNEVSYSSLPHLVCLCCSVTCGYGGCASCKATKFLAVWVTNAVFTWIAGVLVIFLITGVDSFSQNIDSQSLSSYLAC